MNMAALLFYTILTASSTVYVAKNVVHAKAIDVLSFI